MIENNFRYSVNTNHIGEYSCGDSGCRDEGICRCYRIDEIIIESVDITGITEKIFKQIFSNDTQHKREKDITSILYDYDIDLINKYCINRILVSNKVWDTNNWHAESCGGYYGDEVGDVLLNDETFKKVVSGINNILELDTLEDKINYILNIEYGYILDKIKGRKYSVKSVDVDSIDFTQISHLKSVLNKNLEYYSDKNYLKDSIRGVAYWNGTKWSLVDGYHRLSCTKFPKVRIITIE